MKKHNIGWHYCAIAALGILCGCETVTVPPKPMTLGPDYNALAFATNRLISRMRSSNAFNKNYDDIEKAKGCRPVVFVDNIDLLQDGTRLDPEIVRNSVQVSLNESRLFVAVARLVKAGCMAIASSSEEQPSRHQNWV